MEPVGVETMTPSPIRLVTSTPSARTSISATRAMEPLEITASFRARSSESTFSPEHPDGEHHPLLGPILAGGQQG